MYKHQKNELIYWGDVRMGDPPRKTVHQVARVTVIELSGQLAHKPAVESDEVPNVLGSFGMVDALMQFSSRK